MVIIGPICEAPVEELGYKLPSCCCRFGILNPGADRDAEILDPYPTWGLARSFEEVVTVGWSRVDNPPGTGKIRYPVRRAATDGCGHGALHRQNRTGLLLLPAEQIVQNHRAQTRATHWGAAG